MPSPPATPSPPPASWRWIWSIATWGWSWMTASWIGASPIRRVALGEMRMMLSPHEQVAVPDLRVGAVLGRQAARRVGLGQRQQPGLANEVRLGRPDGRDVQLVAPNHGQGDADGTALPVPSGSAAR
jgi:hypothetical protein